MKSRKIEFYGEYFTQLSAELGKIVDINGCSTFDIRCNDKEGHYITTTKARANILKKYIMKNKCLFITVKNEKIKINLTDLELKDSSK